MSCFDKHDKCQSVVREIRFPGIKMTEQTFAALRDVPAFAKLPDACIARLARMAQLRNHDRGATIFLQGERANALRFVLGGWVKLYRVAPCGNEAIIRLAPRLRSLDEMAAVRGAGHSLSAQAVTDVRVLSLDAGAMRALAATEPCLAFALLAVAADNADALADDLERLKVRNGAQRLALFLIDLSQSVRGETVVQLPYEKQVIAGGLGLKPESLSRAFGRLRRHGVSMAQSAVRIDDVARLRDFAEEDPALSWA